MKTLLRILLFLFVAAVLAGGALGYRALSGKGARELRLMALSTLEALLARFDLPADHFAPIRDAGTCSYMQTSYEGTSFALPQAFEYSQPVSARANVLVACQFADPGVPFVVSSADGAAANFLISRVPAEPAHLTLLRGVARIESSKLHLVLRTKGQLITLKGENTSWDAEIREDAFVVSLRKGSNASVTTEPMSTTDEIVRGVNFLNLSTATFEVNGTQVAPKKSVGLFPSGLSPLN